MTTPRHPSDTRTSTSPAETTMTTDTIPDTPAWRRWRLSRGLTQYDTDNGPLLTNLSRKERRVLGRGAGEARAREPGRGLVNAGIALLGLLDAGLLYVVYAAQYAFIFSQKHEHTAAQVQALALDAAMIIFSVLALGLARKGLGAPAERAAIVVCAAASAFMNWTAADQASPRSVAVYIAAPILLALTTDRTISVVRRHVLGMKDDASPWAKLGRALGRLALYTLRAVVDFTGTRRGVKAAILAAAPLPETEIAAPDADVLEGLRAELVATREVVDTFARSFTGQLGSLRELAEDTAQRQGPLTGLREDLAALAGRLEDYWSTSGQAFTLAREDAARTRERLERLELAAGAAAYPTKKAHVLALYRQRGDYGHKDAAGQAARELAEATGAGASTARAYVYEELGKLAERDALLLAGPARDEDKEEGQ